MPASRAFRLTFASAVVLELIIWALPDVIVEQTLYVWLGAPFVLLLAFGFLASREGCRYKQVFANTWLLAGFWFAVGLVHFYFSAAELPAGWSSDDNSMALLGFFISAALMLVPAFAAAALGVAIGRFFSGLRRDPPPAA
jgi:hypothetical protein